MPGHWAPPAESHRRDPRYGTFSGHDLLLFTCMLNNVSGIVSDAVDAWYVNAAARDPDAPFVLATVTVTVPACPAGVRQLILVEVTPSTWAGAEPKMTVAPAAKFEPESVTRLPPAAGPKFGVAA